VSAHPLDDFVSSLPSDYYRRFGPAARAQHAKIAASRHEEPFVLGCVDTRGPDVALCVVAEDRPGLLATVSAALRLVGLEVVEGESFTRALPDGSNESLELFWVRPPVDAETLERLRRSLQGLMAGKLDSARAVSVPPAACPVSETRVRFVEGDAGTLTTLEVESDDRSGLLLALARALFSQRVQIVRAEVRTKQGRVYDRFAITGFDGSPIAPEHRLAIQVAVLSALGPAGAEPATASP